jgi:DNA-3-methyladenine glycosylase II
MGRNLSEKSADGKFARPRPAPAKPKSGARAKKPASATSKGAVLRSGSSPKTARPPKAPVSYHPGALIDGQPALDEAVTRLVSLDPEIVGKLIAVGGPTPLRLQEPGFAGLARIIVAQQVSTASAGAIFGRLEPALTPLSAQNVAAASDETLRAVGLSHAKIRALRALASAVERDGLDLTGLGELVAEEAHRAIVAVKGIGPWTADIFLLFCLGHPDAFPAGDIALQEAAKIVLGLEERPDARRLHDIAERWRPLRGIAARMLWAYYRATRQRVGMALEGTGA